MEQQVATTSASATNQRPRGRMTAYAFFIQACRREYESAHPDGPVDYDKFFKDCDNKWKGMSDAEKNRFNEMAENDKIRYDNEMKNYTPPDDKKRKVNLWETIEPRRNLSAFYWYCHDFRDKVRAENPEEGVGRISIRLGEMWMNADYATKDKYETMADRDKERYEREWAAYQNKKKNGVDSQK